MNSKISITTNKKEDLRVNNSKAFTLIELMVVVSISAIIAAVAIPNYKSYVSRANVTQMITMVEPCKNSIYQYFIKRGQFPDGVTTTPDKQTVICQGATMIPGGDSVRIPAEDSNSKIKATYRLVSNVATFTLTHEAVKEKDTLCLLRIGISESNGDFTSSCSTNCSNNPAIFPTNCAVSQP